MAEAVTPELEDMAAAAYHRWLSMQACQGHWHKLPERSRIIWLGVVESALLAIREPTEAMIEAGDDICPIARGTETHRMVGGRVPEDYWRVMIDAVLIVRDS